MVAPVSRKEWPASDRSASEPEKRPATNLASVNAALAKIEASAALRFSAWVSGTFHSGGTCPSSKKDMSFQSTRSRTAVAHAPRDGLETVSLPCRPGDHNGIPA